MVDSLYYSSRKIPERCENSRVDYILNYQKFCYLMRQIRKHLNSASGSETHKAHQYRDCAFRYGNTSYPIRPSFLCDSLNLRAMVSLVWSKVGYSSMSHVVRHMEYTVCTWLDKRKQNFCNKERLQNPTAGWPAVPSGSGQFVLL